MRDFILHQFSNLRPLDILFIAIGSFFIGVFLTIIIRLKKTAIKYTEYDKKPHKMSLVIGHRGTEPVYAEMWSREFVVFLWRRLKGCQAKIAAMKQIGAKP